MIDYKVYDLNNDDIRFLNYIEECCIGGQNKITLDYNGYPFEIVPHGKVIEVVIDNNTVGYYKGFDDLILHHMIDGHSMIEMVKYLDFWDR